jgi:hypothetical protein
MHNGHVQTLGHGGIRSTPELKAVYVVALWTLGTFRGTFMVHGM